MPDEGGEMKWVNTDNKIPIKSWCEDVEDGAMEQATNLANLPFAFHHVALMPDCHAGYGMPIGGVLATTGVVIPFAVGVDIGCGMGFVETDVDADEVITHPSNILNEFVRNIKLQIPVGFKHHDKPQDWSGFSIHPNTPPVLNELESARYQLGTLGGGNHFIEVQKADTGKLCLMVHSGSRNFGFKIAKYYNTLAQERCKLWHSAIPPFKGEDGLAFLPTETDEAQEYLRSMEFALSFAQKSRDRMMDVAIESLSRLLKGCLGVDMALGRRVNIHHNFAAWEHHFGRNVVVHRKGATQAKKDQLGIIPGSMGTASYIVRGLGNRESFESCSHGAGRMMARGQANRTLTMEQVEAAMGDIVFEIGTDRKGRPDLSEAPQAYKDIDTVIESEKDLVEVVIKLEPLAVVKG
jgi:tRNA-splicing ligase RtcB